tara:strand:+ start:11414 stop:12112 length:699 start_codon:yes stop_codon:yes gene_type:complete
MFANCLTSLNKNIQLYGGKELPLSDDFKKKISLNNKFLIQNFLWDVPGFRRWRVTSFDAGDNIQVLNSVAYPNYENDYPIMGIDLLWFAKSKKLVAILDFQPLIQTKEYLDFYCSDLQELNTRHEKFCTSSMKNIYDSQKFFSPWVILCRGGKDQAEYLPKIFNDFISKYFNLNSNNIHNKFLNTEEVQRKQIDYDIYNSEKDPAYGLFVGFFGENWTNKFINHFLFPLNKN